MVTDYRNWSTFRGHLCIAVTKGEVCRSARDEVHYNNQRRIGDLATGCRGPVLVSVVFLAFSPIRRTQERGYSCLRVPPEEIAVSIH